MFCKHSHKESFQWLTIFPLLFRSSFTFRAIRGRNHHNLWWTMCPRWKWEALRHKASTRRSIAWSQPSRVYTELCTRGSSICSFLRRTTCSKGLRGASRYQKYFGPEGALLLHILDLKVLKIVICSYLVETRYLTSSNVQDCHTKDPSLTPESHVIKFREQNVLFK